MIAAMKIGILECGAVPAGLRADFGSYGAMTQRLLGASRPAVRFDVAGGVLPDSAADCDAYVLTGSAAGVYDDLPWIAGLTGFLQQARGRAKLVGICFGHQIMAQAFGGEVIKSPKGWGVGLHRYTVPHIAPWMDSGADILAPASHQDQVVTLPDGARVVASNAFTPYAGLDYGDAISFQFHPEFSAAFATALIQSEHHRYGALADPAIASHSQPDDCARVAGWIGRFLDS